MIGRALPVDGRGCRAIGSPNKVRRMNVVIQYGQGKPKKRGWRLLLIIGVMVVVTPLVCIPIHNLGVDRRFARYQQRRCNQTMGQIGQALVAHARANGGRYPDRLSLLYTTNRLSFGDLCCDSRRETVTEEEFMAGLDDPTHRASNYVYVGYGLTDAAPPATVILYEHLRNHGQRGINVLYGDGSVAWLDRKAAVALISTLQARARPASSPTTTQSNE
jgi:prepilin-type processing-associated H-X9-DG protein